MKHKSLVRAVCTALLLGVAASAYANEATAKQEEFTLDPVVVTALRSESKDLKTPAYVNVYSEQQLKATGASNLLDALQFTEGITYDGYGASGHLYSSMTAKTIIRGMDRGTVVLINGVPTNMSGYYALERIPLENIEKVEIVKGASSVLYGTSAMGGVINIITKSTVGNTVTLEHGSHDTKKQAVSLQLADISVSASRTERGDFGAISEPYSGKYTAFEGDKRDFFRWSWKLNDSMTLTHEHALDAFHVGRYNAAGNTLHEKIDQTETKDSVSLNIKHDTWQTNVYFNELLREYEKFSAAGTQNADTDTKFKTFGLDTQTSWRTPFAQFTAGTAWQRDQFNSDDYYNAPGSSASSYVPIKERDFHSLFVQMNHPLSDKTHLIVGARQEFINQKEAKDYSEFCPQIQLVTAIDDEQSWYVNVGRAFRMPALSDMYGSTWRKNGNPNLEPEYGYNYEIGWKKAAENNSLKLALYHMDFTNYIQWQKLSDGTYDPYNTEFKNLGVEASYDHRLNEHWTYGVGASVSNPQERSESEEWALAFARLQLTGKIQYTYDKWSSKMAASYLADRKDDLKPTLPVNLSVEYQASQDTTFTLRVENLLDRYDIVSHGSSHYFSTPASYYFGVKQKF